MDDTRQKMRRAQRATEDLLKMQNEKLQLVSRVDPLRARTLLLKERAVESQRRNRRLARVRVLRDQTRFIDYERLFSFRSLSLKPFDLEEIVLHTERRRGEEEEAGGDDDAGSERAGGGGRAESRREKTAAASTSAAGESTRGGGAWTAARREKEELESPSGGSVASSSSCTAWRLRACFLSLKRGGEKVLELQRLLNGFIGIDENFTAPVNPETDENDLYCGRFYSLAFLIEAAVKELLREVDTDYHTPWDAEVGGDVYRHVEDDVLAMVLGGCRERFTGPGKSRRNKSV